MPLKLHLRDSIVLSTTWMDRDTWRAVYQYNRQALIDLLERDLEALIDDADGIAGLVEQAEWVDA